LFKIYEVFRKLNEPGRRINMDISRNSARLVSWCGKLPRFVLSTIKKIIMKKYLIAQLSLALVLGVFSLQRAGAQNVGIGTSNPTQKLDVAGNVNISGTLMANNSAGTSGQVLTSTGSGLAWTTLGSQMGYKKCKVFTSGNGSFTIPAGVTEVMVEAWGGGSGGSYNCGGTSGGYARTVQPVSPGYISYAIGKGTPGASTTDAGTTIVSFQDGLQLYAYGGGACSTSGVIALKGLAKSGGGTVYNSFSMFGNMGESGYSTFGMKNATTYVEIIVEGAGGAPVGMLNANPINGAVHRYDNGNLLYSTSPNTPKTPSAGGPAGAIPFAGVDGMVIVWYN
jgi:hypothetical protein